MEDTSKMEGHLSSAAAFVEGGIQDACDDACSICLEAFCDSDPSTVTGCKHEFHLQCILEWCQRSSQCPMCWQPISLKDPTSQELLEAVEQERSIRVNRSRHATIFHHPMLGDFELQHLPVSADDAELEEHIIQHLAAAAAMGRAHHIARRESPRGENEPAPAITAAIPSVPFAATEGEPIHQDEVSTGQADQVANLPSGNSVAAANSPRNFAGQSTPVSQDRAGPSDFHSFSETLKSRLSAVSMRYKESITKSTRGWKERLFSRSNSIADLGSEVRREVNAGIATVSRMIERLETRENVGASGTSASNSTQTHSVTETSDGRAIGSHINSLPNNTNISASCAANSGPN
ncbi:E3 ubiquitin-protein ligase RHF2A isoform X2 [Elaeis guineensis]|uniref:RING-type E3 ubiquitin transferase n=1 Tax=Elaeis guineensis var. tenera TaxID=51953 RepID=A0A6I9QJN2_ELAGV|nr:E3 ubiquitin-protein ligase RHF2A isoform X2 [Elaeis guineensis]